jgi:hypothetical protein
MVVLVAVPTPTNERVRALEQVNAEFDRRMQEQAASANGIDTKATFLLGAIAIAVQVFLGLDRQDTWAGAAYFIFGLSFVAGLVALWPRGHLVVPNPAVLKERYLEWVGQGVPNVQEQILSTWMSSPGRSQQ